MTYNVHQTNERKMRHAAAQILPDSIHFNVPGCNFKNLKLIQNTRDFIFHGPSLHEKYFYGSNHAHQGLQREIYVRDNYI